MSEAIPIAYFRRVYDILKKFLKLFFLTFDLAFDAQFSYPDTRAHQIENYRVQLHEETGTCDTTTQTQTDHDVSHVFTMPCFPIQYNDSIAVTFKSLVGNKWQSDVTFCIDDEYIAAHRLILAVRSNVFETMLYGFPNSTSRKQDIVFITDISFEVFRQLLIYIYTDHIKITQEDVIDILYAAHKYNLSYLEAKCEDFIFKHMTCGNVLSTMNQLFHFNAFDSIKSKLFEFVCEKFYYNFCTKDCLTSINSILLIKELLVKLVILDHEPDKGRFEFDLFNMLIQWAKAKTKQLNVSDIKWDKLRDCLEGAEQQIKFTNMNAELLSRCVATNPGFFTKDEIYEFFTHEKFLSDSQSPRNTDNKEDVAKKDVAKKDNGFIIYAPNLNLMKSLLPRDDLH